MDIVSLLLLSYKSKQRKPTPMNPPYYYTKLEALTVSIFQSPLSNPTIPVHTLHPTSQIHVGWKWQPAIWKNIISQSQMHTQIVEIWKSTNLQIQKLNWKSFEFETWKNYLRSLIIMYDLGNFSWLNCIIVWLCQSLVTGFRARGGFRVDLALFFIVTLNIQIEHPLKNWTSGKLKVWKG
jgi:hypothetical protein